MIIYMQQLQDLYFPPGFVPWVCCLLPISTWTSHKQNTTKMELRSLPAWCQPGPPPQLFNATHFHHPIPPRLSMPETSESSCYLPISRVQIITTFLLIGTLTQLQPPSAIKYYPVFPWETAKVSAGRFAHSPSPPRWHLGWWFRV